MKRDEQSVVMFVDMLGFAALTEMFPIIDDEDFEDMPSVMRRAIRPPNRLADLFLSFHEVIDTELQSFSSKLLSHGSLEAVTFSDSAFIAMPNVKEAVAMAARMMRSFIKNEVPVRIGIACGSFILLRFKSQTEIRVRLHSSQFLGTAVVRAHEAEQSVPGLRIILHSSARTLATLEDLDSPQVLEIPSLRPVSLGEARPDWAEVNYSNPGSSSVDEELIDALRRMSLTGNVRASHHYAATFEAFNRMRAVRGRPPF